MSCLVLVVVLFMLRLFCYIDCLVLVVILFMLCLFCLCTLSCVGCGIVYLHMIIFRIFGIADRRGLDGVFDYVHYIHASKHFVFSLFVKRF
jgi:hypothetical protein